jgi:hypothetical protein
MFSTQTLEEVIRNSGVLSGRPPTADGWHNVKCAVCNDYKIRGGFKFEPEGVGYHCFNCGTTAVHKNTSRKFSDAMMKVITSFGIDLDAARGTLFSAFASESSEPPPKIDKRLLPAPTIELPPTMFPLNPEKHERYVNYIESRGLSVDSWRWYVSVPGDREWANRLIVPIYNHRDQLVFFQGRTIIKDKKRWHTPQLRKTSVIFQHKKLYTHGESVIVCEGVFDALSVDGVAILGSSFSDYHLAELNKFRGKKIIVPNKDENGYQMALEALEAGFSLAFPDIGSCGDLNEAVVQYGKLYVEDQIYQTVAEGELARFKLSIWTNNS